MPRVAPGGGVRVDGARLLAGPLVFLAAALIFLFCNILSHTQPRRGELDEYAEFVQMEQAISTDNGLLALRGDHRCHRRGVFNESSESCRCPPLFSGVFCERPFCLHGDEVNEFGNCKCRPGHAGVHCERKCNGHQDNRTGACICSGQFFGIGCEFVCVNGHIVNGVCFCNHGFTGLSCSTCTDSSSSSCPSASSASLRRSSVQSRLTLSGLSFCLLTLGLLCLSARRRRLQAHAAEARRRQQAPIRQLLLGLAPISEEELAEGRSASTPPPEYMATMSTPQGLPPPSYEEAMRGGGGEAESEEGRRAVDDIEGCRRSLSSLIKDEDEEEREQQGRREGEERERFEESTSRTPPLDKDAAL